MLCTSEIVSVVTGPVHVAGKVYSQLTLSRNLTLIDLSAVPLHKLGISRKDLIECDASQYSETRAWALALHDQYPNAEGLTWTSRVSILRRIKPTPSRGEVSCPPYAPRTTQQSHRPRVSDRTMVGNCQHAA